MAPPWWKIGTKCSFYSKELPAASPSSPEFVHCNLPFHGKWVRGWERHRHPWCPKSDAHVLDFFRSLGFQEHESHWRNTTFKQRSEQEQQQTNSSLLKMPARTGRWSTVPCLGQQHNWGWQTICLQHSSLFLLLYFTALMQIMAPTWHAELQQDFLWPYTVWIYLLPPAFLGDPGAACHAPCHFATSHTSVGRGAGCRVELPYALSPGSLSPGELQGEGKPW